MFFLAGCCQIKSSFREGAAAVWYAASVLYLLFCLFTVSALLTLRADSLKDESVARDLIAGLGGDRFIELRVIGKRNVTDCAAARTDRMIVEFRPMVVAIRSRDLDVCDLPFLGKDIQISIYRSPAEFWVFCADLQIDLIRTRMIVVLLHHFQNDSTLSCISELPHASARLHITQFDRPSHPVQMILFGCLLADIRIIAQKTSAVNIPRASTKTRPILRSDALFTV